MQLLESIKKMHREGEIYLWDDTTETFVRANKGGV